MGSPAMQIKELLLKKKEMLSKIAEVTKEQYTILDKEDVELLMNNIEQRQNLIDGVDALDREMLELAEGMTIGDNNEKMAFIKRMFPNEWAQVMDVLSGIMEQDKQNEQRALGVIDSYKQQIRESVETRKQVGGYMEKIDQGEGVFFDSKN